MCVHKSVVRIQTHNINYVTIHYQPSSKILFNSICHQTIFSNYKVHSKFPSNYKSKFLVHNLHTICTNFKYFSTMLYCEPMSVSMSLWSWIYAQDGIFLNIFWWCGRIFCHVQMDEWQMDEFFEWKNLERCYLLDKFG